MPSPALQNLSPVHRERARPKLGHASVALSVFVIVAAIGIRWSAVPQADHFSLQDIAQREQVVSHALPLHLTPVAPQDVPAALAGLAISAEQRQALQQAITQHGLVMALLPVFDSGAEDGDVITVTTLGLSQTVRLTKTPVTVPILMPANGQIEVKAVDQGLGGGVTLGIVSNGTPLALAPLASGDTIFLPAVLAAAP